MWQSKNKCIKLLPQKWNNVFLDDWNGKKPTTHLLYDTFTVWSGAVTDVTKLQNKQLR